MLRSASSAVEMPLLLRAVDHLVVDVGEVLDVPHLVAPVLQIPAHHVEDDAPQRVPDVRRRVGSDAADVHLHDTVCNGELLGLSR